MRLSIQRKLFLAFFTTAAILVLFVAGAMHYLMRDGFDDYIMHVKLQRMESIEHAVVQYATQDPSLSVLKIPEVWVTLVLAIDEVKRAQMNKNNNHIEHHEHMGWLPPYARGVALLNKQGEFVAGEPIEAEESLRAEIKNSDNQVVAYWLIRKGLPDNDALGLLFIEQQVKVSILLLGVAALLSMLVAWLLANYFKSPLLRLQQAFRQVAHGFLETRLPVSQTDEMGEIARHFNAMIAQLESQAKARQQWVSNTSHELRTPLTILRMRNEAMRDGIIKPEPDEWQRNLNTISDLTNLVDDLQAVSRNVDGGWDLKKTPVHLSGWLQDVVQDHQAAFQAQGLTLQLQDSPDMIVQIDGQRMTQVLRNVLLNSLRYTDAPGKTVVALSQDKNAAKITISDTAPAVPDNALPHLFERFYRCEMSRNRATGGSGLGLAICEGIIKAHGGEIFAEHSSLGGLSIVIKIPLKG